MPAPPSARKPTPPPRDAVNPIDPGFDWRKIAYHTLVSRAMDDVEEATNRNRTSVPKEHLVLYQFSARGHDVAQAILASLLDHRARRAPAPTTARVRCCSPSASRSRTRSRSPLGRSGGFSDGRDIGVVCNMPNDDGPIVLPMSGDVGSQFTPAAGWAQAITYHRDVLERPHLARRHRGRARRRGVGRDERLLVGLTMATTLKLPMLFYIEDNGLGISVRGDMQTPGGNIAANLASFANLFIRDGDGTEPERQAAHLLRRSASLTCATATARRWFASPFRVCPATRARTTRRAIAPTRRSRRTRSAIRSRS